MSASADVIVVGGGIVGVACAYYLALLGTRVRVLERQFFASGTSRACDGLVLGWDKLSPVELELGTTSAALWAALAHELGSDFEYRREGSIVLAETGGGLAEVHSRADGLRRAGVRAEPLDAAGLHALEPNLAPDLAGGAFYPDDAQLDARLATLALLRGATRLGAVLVQGVEVRGLHRQPDGRVTGVLTAEGAVEAGAVVIAGGVWSGGILRDSGLELPIRPRKGHILVARVQHLAGLITHPLAEGSYAASVKSSAEAVQVALIAEKTAADTLLLGSSREFCGFDRSVRVEVIQAIAARAIRFLPALARASAIRSYAGLRPWSPDHLPLIGPVETHPGLYLATGHEGAGIGLAPVTGVMIAQWLAKNQSPHICAPWPEAAPRAANGECRCSAAVTAVSPGRFAVPNVRAGE